MLIGIHLVCIVGARLLKGRYVELHRIVLNGVTSRVTRAHVKPRALPKLSHFQIDDLDNSPWLADLGSQHDHRKERIGRREAGGAGRAGDVERK